MGLDDGSAGKAIWRVGRPEGRQMITSDAGKPGLGKPGAWKIDSAWPSKVTRRSS
jgi:hypothetical protein